MALASGCAPGGSCPVYGFVHYRTHDGRAIRTLSILDEFTRESLAISTKKHLVGLT